MWEGVSHGKWKVPAAILTHLSLIVFSLPPPNLIVRKEFAFFTFFPWRFFFRVNLVV